MLLPNYSTYKFEAGTDEAGRGCLAGPVVAAAVILPDDFENRFLNDSKKITENQRNILRPIIENEAIAYGVAFIFQEKIDEINILNASILAMHESLKKLSSKPEFIIVDGNKFKNYHDVPFKTIIKGDAKYKSIAAASVLAKTYRDDYMKNLHLEFPKYRWDKNKGYPTKEHRIAISNFGLTNYHRKSFKIKPEQTSIEF